MALGEYLSGIDDRDWQAATAEDGTVRFAMIGLGWWTREQAIPATEASPLCETTVVVSGDREKAASVAEDADAAAGLTYEEFADGTATEEYDAVYVCTPNATHLPHVETAAEFGKDILCEKPMEASAKRAEELVATADDVTLMIAYRMHTEPAVRRARELIRDGVIGEPALVHGNMSQPVMELSPNPDQWRLDPDLAGPGASVTDIGIYPINTARFVLDADPISVTAQMHSSGPPFDDVPDERAAFTATYEDNVHAAITASQNAAITSHLKITGTNGELTIEPAFFPWHDRGLRVTVGETTADIELPQVDQMEEEFTYFADRLLTDRSVYADGEHGLTDMRTIEAIYEAGRTGDRVPVAER